MFLVLLQVTLPEMWQKVKCRAIRADFPPALMQPRTTAYLVVPRRASPI
jgi:hypothetical protein